MNAVFRVYNYVLKGMAVGAGITIFLAFVLIVIDVLMRITMMDPLLFILTTVEYILLYFTMLAAPWLVRIKGHVFIDAVTQFLPPWIKKVVAKIVYLLCIIASLLYGYHVILLFTEALASGEIDMRSYEIPIWILFAPMPLCFFMCAVEFGRFLIGIDDMYDQRIIERENL